MENRQPAAAPVHVALFEPDIPQNTGAILRTAACLGIVCHLIEPAGFVLDDARMRRAGMDYLDLAALVRHASWTAFLESRATMGGGRLIAASTKGSIDMPAFRFARGDVILLGRESAGLPDHAWAACDAGIRIPIAPGARSLNVAQAAAILAARALSDVDAFPASETTTA